VKIGIFGFNNFTNGKEKIVDQRLDTIKQMAHSAKCVFIQIELLTDSEKLKESDGIISLKENKADLILADLEFIEKRLTNIQEDREKNLLNRFKEQLEKEGFISELELTEEENKTVSGYPLLSVKRIFLIEQQDLEDKLKVLYLAYSYFGHIAFFTANEKEARAWAIQKGTTCWQASGLIHSDIQKGFVRAEVIGFNDLINDGGINQARANNHLRLEGKDYIVQDGDLIKFRFSK
jgi:hypothetical protein